MNRATSVAIVFVLIIGIGAIVVAREFHGALRRPAVQRLEHRRTLTALAEAVGAYRADYQVWPDDLFQVLKHAHLPAGANRGYRYRKPAADADDATVIIASEAYHPAVPAGAPYGAQGEVAEHDVPAVADVVTRGLIVEELPLGEARQRSWLAPDVPVR